MTCVVCGQPVADPQYANAWEKARKQFPCCGPACVGRFDPDIHWMPSKLPPAVAEDDERRLLEVSRDRIINGDKPSVVIREMLVAGVTVAGLRKVVFEAGMAKPRRTVRVLLFIKLHDKQDPALLRAASADLDSWRARFFP